MRHSRRKPGGSFARARECDAPASDSRQLREKPARLRDQHQKQNAALAVAALHAAKLELDEGAIARGLASVEWPARFQCWDERTVIDGAHNPGAARVLAQTWKEVFGEQRATLILAVLNDKDIEGIIKALAPIANEVLLPSIRSERALPPEALAKALSTITPKLHHSITPSVEDALKVARTKSAPILLTGSLHFAGEALAYLRGEPAAFEECAQ
jgi:dihydrofolate synthase/folylpolyglutamate synthase